MKRILYRGRLHLPDGFHTGDGRRLGLADQPLHRDADGRVELPGSSLAGVVRADLRRLARHLAGPCRRDPECECPVCQLLGPEAPAERGTEGPGLRASRLYFRGGPAPEPPSIRLRDHVGIDRRTGTAAERRKYDVEVTGAVELPFELRLDDPEDGELELLEAVLRRFADGWLRLGGKSAGGLGRTRLAELERREIDLADRHQLVAYLLEGDPGGGADEDAEDAEDATAAGELHPLVTGGETAPEGWLAAGLPPTRDPAAGAGAEPEGDGWAQLRLGLELTFPWGFLADDPAEALARGFDHAFARRGDGRPVLPGSSLRGALRSRAERILRTLGGPAAACHQNRAGAACHDRINAELEARDKPLEPDAELRRHCLACRVFGSGRLASPFRVTDFVASAAAPEVLRHELVAIDRFTGGAADGAKFDAQAAAGVTLTGELHLELGRHRLAGWGLGLLALLLRHLLLGELPLGFGTAKGFGEYRATITGADRYWLHPPPLLAGAGLDPGPGTRRYRPPASQPLDDPSATALAAGPLGPRLAEWVAALHRRIGDHAPATPEGDTP